MSFGERSITFHKKEDTRTNSFVKYRKVKYIFITNWTEYWQTGWRSRYSDWLRAGRAKGRSSSPDRVKNVPFSTSSRPTLGPNQPPIQCIPEAFSWGQIGRGVKLTIHLQLASRPRKRGFLHPLPHTPLWRSAKFVKHRDNFPLSFTEENYTARVRKYDSDTSQYRLLLNCCFSQEWKPY
jgi:hypothetical protein